MLVSRMTTKAEPMHGRIKYSDDYIGMRFGNLTVIGYPKKGKNGYRGAGAICKCDCGEIDRVFCCGDLINGKVTMCEKCRKEHHKAKIREYCKQNRKANPANAYKYERLYQVWYNMKRRCENPRCYSYQNYGAKGVTICEEWQDYFAFREWAYSHGYDKDAPKGKCTIDRINPFGNYEPSNCRFVDMKTQANNRRSNWIKAHA